MHNNYIGLTFELTRKYTNSLEKIFESININNLTWYVCDSENFISDSDGGFSLFLPDGIYQGMDFEKEISKRQYYIHLLSLYGVPPEKEFCVDKIKTYEDFVKSNAELAFFCGDSIVDLYTKKQNILNSIKVSCLANEGKFINDENTTVSLLTEETNARTGFYV